MKMESFGKTVRLRELLEDFESGSRPKGGVSGILNGTPSLGGEHLNRDGGFNFGKIKFVPPSFARAMTRGHLKIGDVLVVKDGATTGKVSLVRSDFPYQDAVINEHVFRLQIKEGNSPAYVFYFLYSQIGQQQILSDFRGAAQGGISQGFVDKVYVPVVSLTKQKRIVAEIEKQFTRLEAGVAALKRIEANLKRYRASVLKAACEGKLVPTEAELAKKEHRKFETGAELLQRILMERRKNWTGRGKYKEPDALDTTDLQQLPGGWFWSSLAQLAAHITDGTHKTPTYVQSGVPFLSAKDVSGFQLSFDDCRYIPRSEHDELSKRCKVRRGNILITKSGTIGRVAVVETDDEFSLFESVANIPVLQPIEAKFVASAAFVGISGVFGATNQKGVAVRHLHLEDLRRVPIALPPLTEQKRIVAEVDRRLSVVEGLEAVVKLNLNRAAHLRHAVLQKAFDGELC